MASRDGSDGLHILDLVHESIFARDRERAITFWNAAAEKLYGWTRAEAVGRDAEALLECRHPVPLAEREAQLFDTGRWQGEIERITKSGERVSIDATWAVRRDVAGAPVEVIETGRDVTASVLEIGERRRANDALEQSEARYRSIFDRMPIAFWQIETRAMRALFDQLRAAGVKSLKDYASVHPDFVQRALDTLQIIDVNDETVKMIGAKDRAELLGPMSRLWTDQQGFLDAAEERFQGADTYNGVSQLKTRDGRDIDILWTAVFSEVADTGTILSGAIDVTERRRAVRALAASERKYRDLFNYMPVALWQLDSRKMRDMFDELRASGVHDLLAYVADHPEFLDRAQATLRTTEANEQAVRLFGATDRDGLMEQMPALWMSREDWARAAAARLSGARSFSTDSTIRRMDGTEANVIFSVAFADPADPDSLNLVGAIDIEDRLRAERLLQKVQAEFAHAARVATLGELSASIAHEVNQPLAAITTNAEASLRWLARDAPNIEEVRLLAGRMVADAKRAADIIARIRNMASPKAPAQGPVSLNQVVDDALKFLRREFQDQAVQVSFAPASAPTSIEADRTQIQQVVVNLAMNAVQAMVERGPGERVLDIRIMAEPDWIAVEMEDNGPGLSPDQLPHLFDSFVTTKPDGLGIGLSICRSIMEAHGGEITGENGARGALFRFRLPRMEPIAEAGPHTKV